MKKFAEIEAFYQVVRTVAHLNAVEDLDDSRKVLTPVRYRGTVKLHGTNAGVRCTPDALVPQSRSTQLSEDQDNQGFCRFISGDVQQAAVREIERRIRWAYGVDADDPLTIFGEWCGPGIQKGCGIHKLPARQFVVFAAYSDAKGYVGILGPSGGTFTTAGIHTILEGPTWYLDVDFSDQASKEAAAELATKHTSEVEAQCPWAALFGVDGVGEGIVWRPMALHYGRSDLIFKTKGEKHKATKSKTEVQVDPEILASVEAFVDFAVTDNRLAQGLDVLRESGHEIEPRSTGAYLKWVGQDVKRECSSNLEESGLEWKQVSKAVTTKARDFFISSMKVL